MSFICKYIYLLIIIKILICICQKMYINMYGWREMFILGDIIMYDINKRHFRTSSSTHIHTHTNTQNQRYRHKHICNILNSILRGVFKLCYFLISTRVLLIWWLSVSDTGDRKIFWDDDVSTCSVSSKKATRLEHIEKEKSKAALLSKEQQK